MNTKSEEKQGTKKEIETEEEWKARGTGRANQHKSDVSSKKDKEQAEKKREGTYKRGKRTARSVLYTVKKKSSRE